MHSRGVSERTSASTSYHPRRSASSSAAYGCPAGGIGAAVSGLSIRPLVQLLHPVAGDPVLGPRSRLVERMVQRRDEGRAAGEVFGPVVPEPVLTGLEARHDRVARVDGVMAGVLRWRAVAAADVAARGTPPEMEPPAVGRKALGAAGSARRDRRIDVGQVGHHCPYSHAEP